MVDWFLGLLTPAQWDAWRNWLATIGALVALLIATNTYRRNVRIKREEQARLVYSKPGGIKVLGPGETEEPLGSRGSVAMNHSNRTPNRVPYWATVHNGSKELVGPVRIEVKHIGADPLYGEIWATTPTIEPESDYTVGFVFDNHHVPYMPMFGTSVLFRDASGQWWRRHDSQPIERVHNDPANAGSNSGFPLPNPPPVTARVRWHRFWRRLQGKSAIP